MESCPHCRATLSIPDSLAGRVVSCPTCKQSFTAHSPYTPAPAPAGSPSISIQTAPVSHGGSSGARLQRSKKDNSGLIVVLLIVNMVFSGITAGWVMLAEFRIQEFRRGMSNAVEEFNRDMQNIGR